jgi:hypothetical protein
MVPRDLSAAEGAVHAAQAIAEGVTVTGYVTFRGRTFRLGPLAGPDDSSLMPLLEFAHSAEAGFGAEDMTGLSAMWDMLHDCFVQSYACGEQGCEPCAADQFAGCPHFDAGDWPAFSRFARAVGAKGEELFTVVQQATEQMMARPTSARSGSSSPARENSGRSRASSSSPGTVPAAFLEAAERGELINVADAAR